MLVLVTEVDCCFVVAQSQGAVDALSCGRNEGGLIIEGGRGITRARAALRGRKE